MGDIEDNCKMYKGIGYGVVQNIDDRSSSARGDEELQGHDI